MANPFFGGQFFGGGFFGSLVGGGNSRKRRSTAERELDIYERLQPMPFVPVAEPMQPIPIEEDEDEIILMALNVVLH